MKPVHQQFKSISLSTFYFVGFCPIFRLWDFVLWDSVLWDFVRRDFVLWDFVVWDSVRIPYRIQEDVEGQKREDGGGMKMGSVIVGKHTIDIWRQKMRSNCP